MSSILNFCAVWRQTAQKVKKRADKLAKNRGITPILFKFWHFYVLHFSYSALSRVIGIDKYTHYH